MKENKRRLSNAILNRRLLVDVGTIFNWKKYIYIDCKKKKYDGKNRIGDRDHGYD